MSKFPIPVATVVGVVADENASKICNIYGSRGYEFLRNIYENNKNSP